MPEDMPVFSSQPLVVDEPPRKRTTRPRTAKPRATRRPRAATTNVDSEKIEKRLNSIYKDDNGHLPNMRRLDRSGGHSWAGALVWLLILAALLAGAAWAGFFFLPNDKASAEQVSLEILGPNNPTLGATSTYIISFQNKQKIGLNNVTLSVRYPKGFIFSSSSLPPTNQGKNEWAIKNLAGQQRGEVSITGVSYGPLNEEQSWRVFFDYQPENFKSELQKTSVLNTKVIRSPFSVSITGADKITAGKDADFEVKINNDGDWQPKKLLAVPLLPPNFTISTSTPSMDKNNQWTILPASASSTSSTWPQIIKFSGKYTATDTASTTPLKIQLFVLAPVDNANFLAAESAVSPELVSNTISLSTAVNGALKNLSVRPGDMLTISLSLKNTSAATVSKAQVKLNLEGPSVKKQSVLKWFDITDQYDGDIQGQQISDTIRRGILTWNSQKIPALSKLAPGQEVTIDVRLPLKDSEAIDWGEATEYRINLASEASFTDSAGTKQTIFSGPIVIIINSDLKLEQRSEKTSVNGKEKYNLTWVLTNTFHKLKNVSLSADLYGDITYSWPDKPPAGELKLDEKNKRLTWTIPEMPLDIDVLALPFSITLNVKNPSQNTLISKVRLQAEDAVTGEKLELLGEELPLGNE